MDVFVGKTAYIIWKTKTILYRNKELTKKFLFIYGYWKAIQKKSVEIPVQINGKVKFKVEIDVASSKEDVEKIVKTSEGFKAFSECTIKNEVYVPGRIYSIQII